MSTSGQTVQVVDVVAVSGDHRMVTIPDQHRIAVAHGKRQIPRGTVKPLVSIAFRPVDTVVINLVQIHFGRWSMDIAFMWRVAGPVAAGRVNLNQHNLFGGKAWRHYFNDLPRGVSPTAKTAGYLVRT